MSPPKLVLRRGDRTSPLIWALAILCAGIAIAVILTGIVVFAVYLAYRPKAPYIWVSAAHLELLEYDQMGLLSAQVSLTLVAENPNERAHATFSEVRMSLWFQAVELAELRADDLSVDKNRSTSLSYVARSDEVVLSEGEREGLDASLKSGIVEFRLNGAAQTRWRVGVFASVKYSAQLSCPLRFGVLNRTVMGLHCTSKNTH